MASNKIRILLITFFITVLVSALFLEAVFNKDYIHDATYEELVEINGIGDTLANDVLSYLKSNKTCSIEDLDDIKGIGEYRVKLLKKVYGD